MKRLILTTCLCVLFVAGTALADWKEGDPYKMHYPQLPDPYGWDVSFSTALADDWQCSQTGYVKDIHFWVSFKGNVEPPETGPAIYVGIYTNIPADSPDYSTPGTLLWSRVFEDGEYEGEYAGSGLQGWFDPNTGVALPNDHTDYYLLNIDSIEDPYQQQEGTIYWLAIQAGLLSESQQIGWKTSENHWNDDAVYYDKSLGSWQELRYPSCDSRYPGSIDLAFVITPEPATIALLGLGALSLIRRKRSVWIRQAHHK